MDEMHITRDDTDHIGEILMEKIEIPTKIKTAFTREYNKTHKKEKKEEEEGEEEEGEEGEEEDD